MRISVTAAPPMLTSAIEVDGEESFKHVIDKWLPTQIDINSQKRSTYISSHNFLLIIRELVALQWPSSSLYCCCVQSRSLMEIKQVILYDWGCKAMILPYFSIALIRYAFRGFGQWIKASPAALSPRAKHDRDLSAAGLARLHFRSTYSEAELTPSWHSPVSRANEARTIASCFLMLL